MFRSPRFRSVGGVAPRRGRTACDTHLQPPRGLRLPLAAAVPVGLVARAGFAAVDQEARLSTTLTTAREAERTHPTPRAGPYCHLME
ncbi:hypothetical protein [Streptomyces sp. SID3212]|uniref:hypothetical protein n=1 Tax=Streptomyces sp. SID3212 TaxID=2690259 RepID=UPI001369D7EE|nr:hypothetical protein [Streptomyces sp. SID3212]MYV55754.1 hypothetical protein [Streptomyces sp. SID3212]